MFSVDPATYDRSNEKECAVPTLTDSLLDPAKVGSIRAEVRELIDAEVGDKKGASGLAVKGGYSAVKKVSPSVIDDAIEKLWPQFVAKLDPFYQQWGGAGSFADFLVGRSDAVSDALLGVTDERVETTSKSAIKKVYGSLRPSAKKNVAEALPRIGALVQKWS